MSNENICSYETISSYFHLPLCEAATRIGICATILKKICRTFGIKRWPHRKIRSINNSIQKYEDQIKNTNNEEEILTIKSEIALLNEKKEMILKNPNIPINSNDHHSKKSKLSEFENSVDFDHATVIQECYKIVKENLQKTQSSHSNQPLLHQSSDNTSLNSQNEFKPVHHLLHETTPYSKQTLPSHCPFINHQINQINNSIFRSPSPMIPVCGKRNSINHESFISPPTKRIFCDENQSKPQSLEIPFHSNSPKMPLHNNSVESQTLPHIRNVNTPPSLLPPFSQFINQIYQM